MLSQKFRRGFIAYFQKQGHRSLPSSPVVPFDDPTLLFANAGMNQFKDLFLGKSQRDYKRAVTDQKCIRVGGKHNDLENVGHTSRHLTFFEMLGNFSFGDYFKKEAIDFAWEVTLNVFGFDPERLWVSVFREDDEAHDLWKKYLPEQRIVRLDEKDNFWTMGDVGPCGPCSELHYDRGPAFGDAPSLLQDSSGERYTEFWNLVFMQYNKDAQGHLATLAQQSIDTGAGLERIVALKMGVSSVFETDVLRRIIQSVEEISGKSYQPNSAEAAPFHVIADHLRALSFAIADGVQPSNIERGYVLRKILRRAVRYGRALGLERPFLAKCVPTLLSAMGEDFPELQHSEQRICEILTLEEENFLRTLRHGGNLLAQVIERAQQRDQRILGDDIFKLKDTYGLPLEEISLIARDTHLTLDLERYHILEATAKERSKKARKVESESTTESFYSHFVEQQGHSHFVGYETLSTEARLMALLNKEQQEVERLNEGEEGTLFLDQTPFYAEKGGQAADWGVIAQTEGTFSASDCQSPFPGLIAHQGRVTQGSLVKGALVTAHVDPERRHKIANNHTATHLLHWALRTTLGVHVKQAGSLVEPQRLRFDFYHHKPITAAELAQIEELVNGAIREDSSVHTSLLSLEEAQKDRDIIQFFGDKYGSLVRLVELGPSKELCGGTHTLTSGRIGYFRILKESSIAAGIRRIEAVTGEEAEALAHQEHLLVLSLAEQLKVQPAQLTERFIQLLQEQKNLQSALASAENQLLGQKAEVFGRDIQIHHSIPFLTKEISGDASQMRSLADLLIQKHSSLLLVLALRDKQSCSLLVRATPDLISKGVRADALVRILAPLVGGKGGGKAESAQAGGTHPQQLSQALAQVKSWIDTTFSSAS